MKLALPGPISRSATTIDTARRPVLVARCAILAGALIGVRGAIELVRWARRWYVADELAGATATQDAAAWHELYQRYQVVHETLLEGMLLVLAGTLVVAVGLWAHHRATCRSMVR